MWKKPTRYLMVVFFVFSSGCNSANQKNQERIDVLPNNTVTENNNSATELGSEYVVGATLTPVSNLFAQFVEGNGDIEIKQPDMLEFSEAILKTIIQENGQLQTGANGRARLDLSDQSIIRVGPTSIFTLLSLSGLPDDTISQIKLFSGKLWAILRGESISIDTPAGLVVVRGSYIGIEIEEVDLSVTVNCFEGDCLAQNDGGQVELVAGQSIIMADIESISDIEPIAPSAIEEWEAENPEAQQIIPVMQETVQAWMALTPTPEIDTGNGSDDSQDTDSPNQTGGANGDIVLKMASEDGNTVTVSQNDKVTVRFGWGAITEAYVQDFFNVASLTYYIDGEALPDSGGYMGDMENDVDFNDDGVLDYYKNYFYNLPSLTPGSYIISVYSPAHTPVIDGHDANGDGTLEEYTGPWDFSFTLVVTE